MARIVMKFGGTSVADLDRIRAVSGVEVAALLAQVNDLPLSEVAVIGDMENDMPMFAVAGLSVAMGDASPEVRSAAGHVTAANDRDGWARAVDEIVLRAE